MSPLSPPPGTLQSLGVRTFYLLLIVTLAGGAGASCAKARASTEPVMPVLTPPPPPPRVIEAFPQRPVPTIEPGPLEAALTRPPSPTPPRPATRPEPKEVEPEPVVVEPTPPPPPALTLKPAPSVASQTQASIRNLLERASDNLRRVKYAALDADGRAQYDTARRFMQQAEEALKDANLAFAGKLADKAATMAAVLVR